jgi:hypothetical protein
MSYIGHHCEARSGKRLSALNCAKNGSVKVPHQTFSSTGIGPRRFELLDAKWTEKPSPRDLESLLIVGEQLGEANIISRTLVCRTEASSLIEGNVRAVPIDEVSTAA